MRLLAIVAFGSACVPRVQTTRVTLFDPSIVPPALALGFGVAILAVEIHARLAEDVVSVVR